MRMMKMTTTLAERDQMTQLEKEAKMSMKNGKKSKTARR